MICASEDVGNADPQALVVATNASLACERIGLPESRIILAQAAAYVACAPKSNSSIVAIDKAMQIVDETGNLNIPSHLKDAHYKGAAKLGNGYGYLYPHDFDNNWCKQQYLPTEIQDEKIYNLSDNGYEKEIKDRFNKIKK
jgi:putative ATPase